MIQENEAIVIIEEGTDAEMGPEIGCCFTSFVFIH
jgi:hypothetical protein